MFYRGYSGDLYYKNGDLGDLVLFYPYHSDIVEIHERLSKLIVFAKLKDTGHYCYTWLCTSEDRGTNLCKEKKTKERKENRKGK